MQLKTQPENQTMSIFCSNASDSVLKTPDQSSEDPDLSSSCVFFLDLGSIVETLKQYICVNFVDIILDI